MSQSPFHIMTKPVSHQCNLKCDYCFYLEKDAFYPQQSRMSMEMLEEYVRTYIESSPQQHVDFAWQGGEPTLAGLDFYKSAVEFQNKYSAGKRITNSFQTNGIAINHQWAEFFAQHQFLIGLSVDGDASIHDKYRISTNGKPTFERVKHVIGLLLEHKVEFNTLTVVNDANWDKGKQVYQTLKSLGSTHMQFIPVVEQDALQKERFDPTLTQEVTPFSVPKSGYGTFMTDVFDEWVKQDLGKIHIQAFEMLLAQHLGYPAGLCIFSENCGDNLVLEANGDLYSCDHFVYPENKLGNIHSQPMLELAQSKQQKAFGQSKSATLTALCQSCEYLSQCHGGCPKQRIVPVEGETHRQNYLCESYKKLFSHTHKPMASMAKQIASRRH
ncbi:anaerobic sulfatase maturase [Vibrio alfacsensis]|uniref:Anaerobic sulfatase maturase n=1 Tax=Vibrio alfacsensis TaxID=1074311 RepID=A0ABN5PH45_9VIBR|nr:anaerobic sulfatase maturase [Vibrio alfacsensis]AXY02415.1 anaerobic sulfatase maturase [Vibrio alfacsensis]